MRTADRKRELGFRKVLFRKIRSKRRKGRRSEEVFLRKNAAEGREMRLSFDASPDFFLVSLCCMLSPEMSKVSNKESEKRV